MGTRRSVRAPNYLSDDRFVRYAGIARPTSSGSVGLALRWFFTIVHFVGFVVVVGVSSYLPGSLGDVIGLAPGVVLAVLALAPVTGALLIPARTALLVTGVEAVAVVTLAALVETTALESVFRADLVLAVALVASTTSLTLAVARFRFRRIAGELLSRSYQDRVSRLPNRYRLLEDIRRARDPALALLKAERFGEINSCFGYEFGESYLVNIQRVIAETLNETLTQISVYHVERDVFAVLQQDVSQGKSKAALRERFDGVIRLLRDQTFTIGDYRFPVPVSAGISLGSAKDPVRLYNQAEQALTAAIHAHRREMFFSDSELVRDDIVAHTQGLALISHALRHDRVEVVFQPIMRNRGSTIEMHESLVRIRDDNGALVPPAGFLQAAKLTAYHHELSRRVFELTFKRMYQNDDAFSVNISVEDICDDDFLLFLADLMKRYGRCRDRCILEITESEGVENYEQVLAFIRRVRELGYRIALDDFGSGYSNFAGIMRLPIDYIKFDGEIVQSLATDPRTASILGKMTEIARDLKVRTIAEYVDSKELLAHVRRLRIDYSQGFLIGRPAPRLKRQVRL